MDQSRRKFICQSLCAVAAGAAATVMPVIAGAENTANEVPAYPYPYKELDPAVAEKVAYEGYFENGCCYGVAKGLLAELREKVGYPYTMIPAEMFANGKEGYTCGTLCGALGGAVGIIGLCCGPDDSRELVKKLFAWYTSTDLPIYQPEEAAPVQTVAPSVNCSDSITTFMTAANVERKDPIRKRRCGGLSGDVARKTVELLNVFFGYAEEAPVEEAVVELGENQYLGEGKGFGEEPVVVRVTMDGDKIANVEVMSHGETAGIGTKAIDAMPAAFVGKTAAEVEAVDTVSGATVTSGALRAAVLDALSKVK